MVLGLFIREPAIERYGLEVIEATGMKSGSLYPILHRLESRGFLLSSWEDPASAIAAQRRPRRRYRLATDSTVAAQAALTAWQEAKRRDGMARRAIGGGLAS